VSDFGLSPFDNLAASPQPPAELILQKLCLTISLSLVAALPVMLQQSALPSLEKR
jgi:hypothetical protein